MRAKPVSTAEAISRLDLMLRALEKETRNAIWVKATLEVGNAIVMAEHHGKTFGGVDCYNALRNSTQTALILSLWKLFEHPRGRDGRSKTWALNRSDLASIPVFLHFLKQKRCRTELIKRALAGWDGNALGMSKVWEKDCLNALKYCDDTTKRLKSHHIRQATKILWTFRNDHVAHLYKNGRPWSANRYSELFSLLDIASDFVSHASISLRGCNLNLKEFEESCIDAARAFWAPALAAAVAADSDVI